MSAAARSSPASAPECSFSPRACRPRLPAQEKKFGADGMPNGWRDDPTIYISLAEDGTVTVTCHRSEMGQGVRTSIAMVVADELEADWARVRVAQAWGDEERFGNQDTDGSRSLRHWFMPMRRAGAAARTMLEQAAAAQWGVPASEVRAANHGVTHARERAHLGLRRAGQSCGGAARAGSRHRAAQGAVRLPLHRQGHHRPRRQPRLHHGQGDLRHRRPRRGHALRGHRPPAGLRRQGGVLRRRRRPEGAGGRQGHRDRSAADPVRVRAARRRRGHRPQHLGRPSRDARR